MTGRPLTRFSSCWVPDAGTEADEKAAGARAGAGARATGATALAEHAVGELVGLGEQVGPLARLRPLPGQLGLLARALADGGRVLVAEVDVGVPVAEPAPHVDLAVGRHRDGPQG